MSATTAFVTGEDLPDIHENPPRNRRSLRNTVSRIPGWIFITLLLIIVIYPMVWMFLGSFKTQDEFLNAPFWALPENWSLDNYVEVFTTGDFGTYVRNSILVVFPSLALILILGVAAGFALEVMVWRGKATVLLLFLIGIMVPTQMILLPLFTIYFRLHLTGTFWPLIITYVATGLPLTVFMMATFFRAVPREIFEAATLDGANIFRIVPVDRRPARPQRAVHRRARAVLLPLERPARRADVHHEQRAAHHPGGPAQLHRAVRRGAVRPDLRRDRGQRLRDARDLPVPQPAGHEGPHGRIGQGLT